MPGRQSQPFHLNTPFMPATFSFLIWKMEEVLVCVFPEADLQSTIWTKAVCLQGFPGGADSKNLVLLGAGDIRDEVRILDRRDPLEEGT